MKTLVENITLTLPEGDCFSPDKTFNCGQCFRFEETDTAWQGVVGESLLIFPKNQTDGKIEIVGGEKKSLEVFLDADVSYTDITKSILENFSGEDFEVLKSAAEVSRGMRILKQDFWEALCSFIISQNNNIPRIKKNVKSICEKFGERKTCPSGEFYTFPSPEAILWAGKTGLDECRLGFRTKYILDAAEKVRCGEISEEKLLHLPDRQAKDELMKIHGVGEKVASCALLYGLGRRSAVPVDVWMKKIFKKYFDRDTVALGEYGGIAQQYLFFFERFIIEGKKV